MKDLRRACLDRISKCGACTATKNERGSFSAGCCTQKTTLRGSTIPSLTPSAAGVVLQRYIYDLNNRYACDTGDAIGYVRHQDPLRQCIDAVHDSIRRNVKIPAISLGEGEDATSPAEQAT